MGTSESRNESVNNGRLVCLTQLSDWRKAYRLLRDSCGLTHHEARAIFGTHLGGLSYHRNLLYSELKRDKAEWSKVAEGYALMIRSDKVSQFISNLEKAIWGEDDDPLCYTLVREICELVRDWNDWGEDERLLIHETTQKVLKREQSSGLKAWTDRHLLTYLRINNIPLEV